jgi:putative ABC transport system permease protein
MHTLWQDVRYGLRVLSKNPGFAITAILTLALGIGATTAIFSVVYAALLQPLPYPQPERILRVWELDDAGHQNNFSDPNFEDLRDGNKSFESFAEFAPYVTTVTGGPEAVRINGAAVSKQFFGALGIQPMLGRAFLPEETKFGGTPAVLISNNFWRSSLGEIADFSKVHLNFDGKTYAVVGVLPQGFRFPDEADVWIPREQLERFPSRTALNWRVIGRLKSDATLGKARADLSTLAKTMKQRLGDDTWMADTAVVPLQEALVGKMRTVLMLLLGAAGVLLLAACANTANLLLSRAVSRQKEFAVRVAMGANRGRLISQLFTESLLLSVAGGALGVAFANWGVSALMGLDPGRLSSTVDVHVSAPVLAFTLFVSFATAAGLGLILALRAMRINLNGDLKEGQQRQSGGAGEVRVRAALMASQVAVATILLAGAGLLTRSLIGLMEVNPGFRTANILTMQMFPSEMQNDFDKAHRGQELEQILRRMRAIPGIDSVGLVKDLPLTGDMANGTFLLVENQDEMKTMADFERVAKNPERTGSAFYQAASADYFATMQIPLLRGRLFDERDGYNAPNVAVISESLARDKWAKQDPIGHHIEFGNMDGNAKILEIVGVVADVHGRGLEEQPEPTVYVNTRQRVPTIFTVVAHTTGSPQSIVGTARNLLREIDPDLAPKFQVFPEIVSKSVGDREFQLCLIVSFAIGALALAVLGLYGVTSYLVSERTREIGIRVAVGAEPGDVIKLIVGQSGRVVLIGIVLGVLGTLGISSVLRGLLYGIKPSDPVTLAGVCVLLGALAIIACWIPARRATRIDPMTALRYE